MSTFSKHCASLFLQIQKESATKVNFGCNETGKAPLNQRVVMNRAHSVEV